MIRSKSFSILFEDVSPGGDGSSFLILWSNCKKSPLASGVLVAAALKTRADAPDIKSYPYDTQNLTDR